MVAIPSTRAILPTTSPTFTKPTTPDAFWSECLRLVASNRRLRMIVEDTSLISLANNIATIAVGSTFAGLARNASGELEELFSRAAGNAVKIAFQEQTGGTNEPARTLTHPAANGTATPDTNHLDPAEPTADVRQHPLVKQAEELFGARVVRVDSPRVG